MALCYVRAYCYPNVKQGDLSSMVWVFDSSYRGQSDHNIEPYWVQWITTAHCFRVDSGSCRCLNTTLISLLLCASTSTFSLFCQLTEGSPMNNDFPWKHGIPSPGVALKCVTLNSSEHKIFPWIFGDFEKIGLRTPYFVSHVSSWVTYQRWNFSSWWLNIFKEKRSFPQNVR